jgi:hypothetical protein
MEAVRELLALKAHLETQLRNIHAELDAVNKTITVLQRDRPTSGRNTHRKEFSKLGLTDSIRAALTGEFQTPVQIRNAMLEGGYAAKDRASLLNSVYATVKRLADKTKEAEAGKINGVNAYRKAQSQSATERAAS